MEHYGLSDSDWASLRSVFARNKKIERVILFGSRAKGTNKAFSDVDMTLVGKDLTHDDLTDVMLQIDDLLLPYNFDLSIYNRLSDQSFISHIQRVGVTVYGS